jgi:formate dehydrogenase iron-sulfur subunit
MCYHRLKEGNQPACAEACPAEAVTFGTKRQILAEARLRIVEHADEYVPKIYGERVVGGTSVFFLSAVPFEQLAMRVDLGEQPLPELTWQALSKIPEVVSLGGALIIKKFWIIDRRNKNGKLKSRYNGEGS